MMSGPDLFTVYQFSPEDWRDEAEGIIRYLASTGQPFTADDLRDMGLAEPDHPNRFGALFNAMAHDEIIRCVGYAKARKVSRKGGRILVWQGANT